MRMIDADALLKHTRDHDLISTHIIANAPTVDAVEVVRCKDCKWYVAKKRKCMLDEIPIAENDYCSYGERRADG